MLSISLIIICCFEIPNARGFERVVPLAPFSFSHHHHHQQQQQANLPFLQPHKSEFQSFCNGDLPFLSIPNAFDSSLIRQLKLDALSLRQNGFGSSAGIAQSIATDDTCNDRPVVIRKDVHQIWLSTPSGSTSNTKTSLEDVYCGQLDARKSLFRIARSVAMTIQLFSPTNSKYTGIHPSIPAELSYLLYEPGSHYQRHVDNIQNPVNRDHQRAVSMILYLGHDNGDSNSLGEEEDDRPYDMARDGGALRVYYNSISRNNEGTISDAATTPEYFDVPPVANTLVLFDSASVPHEVLETTFRSRVCIVGWFHAYTNF